MSVAADPFRLTDRITLFPVLHGSGDYALAARSYLLDGDWDALAVPLPPSMRRLVEEGIEELPHPSVVLQRHFDPGFSVDSEFATEDASEEKVRKPFVAYVPTLHLLDAPNPLGLPLWLSATPPLVALVCVLVARWVWALAIRQHQSTGT